MRIITTRTREELGGINASEWKAAREGAFKTTVLALNVEPGMVCSLTHPDMPGGVGKFRVIGWKLNPDYSIDIAWRTVTDSMYDLTIGPKPVDVQAEAPPGELVLNPTALTPAADSPTITAATVTLEDAVEEDKAGARRQIFRIVGTITRPADAAGVHQEVRIRAYDGATLVCELATAPRLYVGNVTPVMEDYVGEWRALDPGSYTLKFVSVNRDGVENTALYTHPTPLTIAAMPAAPAPVAMPAAAVEYALLDDGAGNRRLKYRFKGSWTLGSGGDWSAYWFNRVKAVPITAVGGVPTGADAVTLAEEEGSGFQTDWFDISSPICYRITYTPVNRLGVESVVVTPGAVAADHDFAISTMSAAPNDTAVSAEIEYAVFRNDQGVETKKYRFKGSWTRGVDDSPAGSKAAYYWFTRVTLFTVVAGVETGDRKTIAEEDVQDSFLTDWFDIGGAITYRVKYIAVNKLGVETANPPAFEDDFAITGMPAPPAIVTEGADAATGWIEYAVFETAEGRKSKYRFGGLWVLAAESGYFSHVLVEAVPQPSGTPIVLAQEDANSYFLTDWFDIGSAATYRLRYTPINRVGAAGTAAYPKDRTAGTTPYDYAISATMPAAANVTSVSAVVQYQSVDTDAGRKKQFRLALNWAGGDPAVDVNFWRLLPTVVWLDGMGTPTGAETPLADERTPRPVAPSTGTRIPLYTDWWDVYAALARCRVAFRAHNKVDAVTAGAPVSADLEIDPEAVVTVAGGDGYEAMSKAVDESVTPDLANGVSHAYQFLSGDTAITVKPVVNAALGQEFVVIIIQDAAGAKRVSWDAKYKGMEKLAVDPRAGMYTAIRFITTPGGNFTAISSHSGVWAG
ncbi:MAG: hypothetical protein M1541_16470 [Acidobacteria bacterium]|nr:hypothetical protein [Acidobacteriota bacterium]